MAARNGPMWVPPVPMSIEEYFNPQRGRPVLSAPNFAGQMPQVEPQLENPTPPTGNGMQPGIDAPQYPGMNVEEVQPAGDRNARHGLFSFMDQPGASDAMVGFSAAMLKAPTFLEGLVGGAKAVNDVAREQRYPDMALSKLEGFDKMPNSWKEYQLAKSNPGYAASVNGNGGMFDGKSVEGQALNYLIQTGGLTKDQAAQIAAGKPITGADGSMHFLTPEAIVNAADAAKSSQTEGGGQASQAGIPLGPAKKTEAQIKGEAILAGAVDSFQPAVSGFDNLKDSTGQIGGELGDAGRFLQSGEYQVTADAVKNITQAYIYALSGQQAPEAEVQRQMSIVMPRYLDKDAAIEGKRKRLMSMINTIKSRAQGPGGEDQSQKQPSDEGWTTLSNGVKIRRKQ